MTLRELLAQHQIDLDIEVSAEEVRMERPPGYEYAGPGGVLVRQPGATVLVELHFAMPAAA